MALGHLSRIGLMQSCSSSFAFPCLARGRVCRRSDSPNDLIGSSWGSSPSQDLQLHPIVFFDCSFQNWERHVLHFRFFGPPYPDLEQSWFWWPSYPCRKMYRPQTCQTLSLPRASFRKTGCKEAMPRLRQLLGPLLCWMACCFFSFSSGDYLVLILIGSFLSRFKSDSLGLHCHC